MYSSAFVRFRCREGRGRRTCSMCVLFTHRKERQRDRETHPPRKHPTVKQSSIHPCEPNTTTGGRPRVGVARHTTHARHATHDERAIGFARLVQALHRVRADDGARRRIQSVFHRYVVVCVVCVVVACAQGVASRARSGGDVDRCAMTTTSKSTMGDLDGVGDDARDAWRG